MEALQTEILGWLGYLDRWSVSWQITFILVVAITTQFAHRSTSLFRNNPNSTVFLAPLTLLGSGLILGLTPLPTGILLQVGLFWVAISSVSWIESRLKIKNPKNQAASWLSKVVRPAILIFAITYFIERLSSLSDISLISLGSFSNTNLTIGNTFLLAVGLYLILATSQTLAAITSI